MIAALPGAHFMQTSEWAKIKTQTGWLPLYRVWYPQENANNTVSFQLAAWESRSIKPVAAALVLQRTIALGGFAARLRVLYVPKGPLLDWENIPLRRKVLADLKIWLTGKGQYLSRLILILFWGRVCPIHQRI